MERKDVVNILKGYGRWGNCRYGTEYPRFALSMLNLEQTCYTGGRCTDAQGMLLDEMVTRLWHINQEYHQLLVAHFVYNKTQDELATALDVSRRTVRDKLDAAIYIMFGMIIYDPKIYATLSFLKIF